MKRDFAFRLPYLNAAGFLGFAPDARSPVDWSRLGGFVTNPVSREPRAPTHGQRFVEFPGGFLLHTGHPNPGLKTVLRRYSGRWRRSPLPVIVHVLAQGAEDAAWMARRLERDEAALEGVLGLELGLPPGLDSAAARSIVEAACGELPVIVRIPLDQATELARTAILGGAAAVSLGAPRGLLPGLGGELVSGRLYGPALFPLALAAVRQLAHDGIPVIGTGGVYSADQAQAMLSAGALAVQLDAVLWRGGWE